MLGRRESSTKSCLNFQREKLENKILYRAKIWDLHIILDGAGVMSDSIQSKMALARLSFSQQNKLGR